MRPTLQTLGINIALVIADRAMQIVLPALATGFRVVADELERAANELERRARG